MIALEEVTIVFSLLNRDLLYHCYIRHFSTLLPLSGVKAGGVTSKLKKKEAKKECNVNNAKREREKRASVYA